MAEFPTELELFTTNISIDQERVLLLIGINTISEPHSLNVNEFFFCKTDERGIEEVNVSMKSNRSPSSNARSTQMFGSNGLKLSKLQYPDDNWLCSHYKRHCQVKFDCCDKFWPCHRCHNDQGNCDRKTLESRDTKMVKCVYCDKEQPVSKILCGTCWICFII